MSLASRFALVTSVGLAIVMALAGWMLLSKSRELVDQTVDSTLRTAARAQTERQRAEGEGFLERASKGDARDGVGRFKATIREGSFAGRSAHAYEVEGGASILVPDPDARSRENLRGLVVLVGVLVAGAGAALAAWAANSAAGPLRALVDDVQALARRGLRHSVKAHGPREVVLLGRAISRMAQDLLEAREAELELGVRQREQAVAREVSDALRPQSTPEPAGWTILDGRLEGSEIGGSFHEYLELEGRTVVVLCDVTGEGVPGALVGATARAFLRAALEREGDLPAALARVNRDLHRDLQPGLAVTALCVALHGDSGRVEIACAGHQVAPLRWSAARGVLEAVHPEGIALGFDKGPFFERSLEAVELNLEPGDALLLASTGLVAQPGEGGVEWGEDALRASARQHLANGPYDAIAGVQDDAQAHRSPRDLGQTLPDATVVVVGRDATP